MEGMLEIGTNSSGNSRVLVHGLPQRYTLYTSVFLPCSQEDTGSIDFDKLDCDKFMKKFWRKEIIFATPDWFKLWNNPAYNEQRNE